MNSVENRPPTFCVGESGVDQLRVRLLELHAARATARRTARPRRSARRARSSGTGGRRPRRPAGRAAARMSVLTTVRLTRGTDSLSRTACRPPVRVRRAGRDGSPSSHGSRGIRRTPPAPGWPTNACQLADSVIARRAHSGVAPASPQVGVGTARSPRRVRSKPRRSARSKARRARVRRAGRSRRRGPRRRARPPARGDAARRRAPRHRGHQPEQQRDPRVPHLAERVERRRDGGRAADHGQGGVDPDPRRRRSPASSRSGGFAAQQCTTTGTPRPATRSRSRSWASGPRTDRTVPQPDAVGSVPASTAGRLGSSSWTSTARPGPLRDLRDVGAQALAQAAGELADGAAVGEHPVPGVQLDRRRERPRPGGLHLHPLGPRTGAGGVEGVDVEAQQVQRAPVVAAGARRDPPAGGHDLDGEVDEQRGGAADHVGADPARGQLGQVRQQRQLADDRWPRPRRRPCRAASRRRSPPPRASGPARGRVRRAGRRARRSPAEPGTVAARRGTGEAGGGQRGLEVGIGAHRAGVPAARSASLRRGTARRTGSRRRRPPGRPPAGAAGTGPNGWSASARIPASRPTGAAGSNCTAAATSSTPGRAARDAERRSSPPCRAR